MSLKFLQGTKKPLVFPISPSRFNIQYFHLVKNSYNVSTYQSDAPKCTR